MDLKKLSPQQQRVMDLVSEKGSLTSMELFELVEWPIGSVTARLTELSKFGLLETTGDTDDQGLLVYTINKNPTVHLDRNESPFQMTAGSLGLCGPVGTEEACAPGCCKEEPTAAAQLAEDIEAYVTMEREVRTTSTGRRYGLPEDEDNPAIREATQLAYDALKDGRSLLAVTAEQVAEGWTWAPPTKSDPSPTCEESILQEAERIVNGPRREGYGHPAVNFARIAHLWNGYMAALIEGVPDEDQLDRLLNLMGQDVCQMMVQLKQCRLIQNPDDRDGHVDIAGYAQCSKLISEHGIASARQTLADLARDVD